MILTFAQNLGVNILLLPMGRGDDGAQWVLSSFNGIGYHLADCGYSCSSTNEKIDRSNFLEGVSTAILSSAGIMN